MMFRFDQAWGGRACGRSFGYAVCATGQCARLFRARSRACVRSSHRFDVAAARPLIVDEQDLCWYQIRARCSQLIAQSVKREQQKFAMQKRTNREALKAVLDGTLFARQTDHCTLIWIPKVHFDAFPVFFRMRNQQRTCFSMQS
jgi:hypothetical protein